MNRIPLCNHPTIEGMRTWFRKMKAAGLLFHPDDSAFTVVNEGRRVFSDEEALIVDRIMERAFQVHGQKVHELALSVHNEP